MRENMDQYSISKMNITLNGATVVNAGEPDLIECVDCGKKMKITIKDKRYLLAWCALCATKLSIGIFNDAKEILSLDAEDILKWVDTGCSQVIKTSHKTFIINFQI
jgi:hypothetical protein